MKKTMCTLLCVLLLTCMSGCDKPVDTYAVFPVVRTQAAVNQNIIDQFLTDNADYPNYEEIKKNVPDILSYLVNITPDALKEKCSIYRFTYETHTGLAGEAFLVYDNTVYPLGRALGGYGITEFAYTGNNGNDILYFIYSWGSGMHRSHIGAFNFKTKQITGYYQSEFLNQDIAFQLAEDGKTLAVCRAQILWADGGVFEVSIDKGECLFENIHTIEFATISTDK